MTKIKLNRLEEIKRILRTADRPVSGTALAEELGVSRQVIVQDISLLRAQKVPIKSTNRGYLIEKATRAYRVFKVKHLDEDIERELNTMVDLGATVEDVFVCHRVYGTIRAEMNIKSRKDVANFIAGIANSVSTPLKGITNDYHFHTLSAEDEETLDLVEDALEQEGILVGE